MEMRANGYVGFRDLYADNIISSSIVPAYGKTKNLYVSTEYVGNYYNLFTNLRDAVAFVNGKYLREDVTISFWNGNTETIYDTEGILIDGLSGPGTLTIKGNPAKTVSGHIEINNCTTGIYIDNLTLRDGRPRQGSNS